MHSWSAFFALPYSNAIASTFHNFMPDFFDTKYIIKYHHLEQYACLISVLIVQTISGSPQMSGSSSPRRFTYYRLHIAQAPSRMISFQFWSRIESIELEQLIGA
ncbi:hypothetical protein AVEN_230244-1 [Araneus ventricosus]|uniref:Uncharacterized protein n=1 Tax=Araneus ventricosus TaxID=182803 RepID=A0A4Y2DX59_ARAVE|nr:hypothetical protein AVEN_230244-1 [Araneus ventricosus]